MSEETQQPDSENPDVVRSPKNTERDLEAERTGNTADGAETVRELIIIDAEATDSPKNDRPLDLTTLAQTVETPEVVRKLVVIEDQADTDGDDRSPKNDRDFKR
ncbi:MAG: hypothetical protein KME27_28090 [Lyngbya sp. HA4199-MV5]|jgi:hypothetical protein|nr:hypothetical protein [Lyngbya sp. HA4199-MV5]